MILTCVINILPFMSKSKRFLCAKFFVSFRPVWNNPVELKVRDCVQGVFAPLREAFLFGAGSSGLGR